MKIVVFLLFLSFFNVFKLTNNVKLKKNRSHNHNHSHSNKQFTNNNIVNNQIKPQYVNSIDTLKSDPYNGANKLLRTDLHDIGTKNQQTLTSRDSQAYDYAGTANNYSNQSYPAVSTSNARVNNPIYNPNSQGNEVLKTPNYIEKIGYYNDLPTQREVEAINISNDFGNSYYQPFKHKILRPNTIVVPPIPTVGFAPIPQVRCELIVSPLACQTTGLCVWDKFVNVCVMSGVALR